MIRKKKEKYCSFAKQVMDYFQLSICYLLGNIRKRSQNHHCDYAVFVFVEAA